MKMSDLVVPVAAVLLLTGQAAAQTAEQARQEAEARAQESVERYREAADVAAEKAEVYNAEYAERLREAEEQMEKAARRVAEITEERLPQYMKYIEKRMEFNDRPRLGITIDGTSESGPVDGVEIMGVTPESAADNAGLRAGDVITAVNNESLGAESSEQANKRLLEFMQGVTAGDELTVEYSRNGNVGSVALVPRVMEMHAFAWAPEVHMGKIPGAPHLKDEFVIDIHPGFPLAGSAWGRMELVELSEDLGRYFGTSAGLLVISAPEDASLDLQDGDVIQLIDGREPKDVRHAMRILSSYQGGEKLQLGIMRDKQKRTLDVSVPANQRGSLWAPAPVKPVVAPAPPKPAASPDTLTT